MREHRRTLHGPARRAIQVAIAAIVLSTSTAHAQGPFYRASPQEIAGGPPGTLIRSQPMSLAPAGSWAHRVLYRSRGMRNEPIAVSGVVIVPPGAPPPGGRRIVAWAHPTTGVVPRCAPSLALFIFQQIQGSRPMVEQGYVIAATDYPGLGTPGPHPYLVGESQARAVIDSMRVARAMPEAAAGNSFAVWGHSQGGHAALYTGLIQRRYAPELNLVGVAAAAPATELATLLNDDINTAGGRNLTAMTLWSWARVYGAPIRQVVAPQAMPTVDALAQECIESISDLLARERTERPLARQFLSVSDLASREPWNSLLARNTPGTLPPDIPVFIAQGTKDGLVRPEVTQDYANRLCRAGSRVRMLLMSGVSHGMAAHDATLQALQWIGDRFGRQPAPSDC